MNMDTTENTKPVRKTAKRTLGWTMDRLLKTCHAVGYKATFANGRNGSIEQTRVQTDSTGWLCDVKLCLRGVELDVEVGNGWVNFIGMKFPMGKRWARRGMYSLKEFKVMVNQAIEFNLAVKKQLEKKSLASAPKPKAPPSTVLGQFPQLKHEVEVMANDLSGVTLKITSPKGVVTMVTVGGGLPMTPYNNKVERTWKYLLRLLDGVEVRSCSILTDYGGSVMAIAEVFLPGTSNTVRVPLTIGEGWFRVGHYGGPTYPVLRRRQRSAKRFNGDPNVIFRAAASEQWLKNQGRSKKTLFHKQLKQYFPETEVNTVFYENSPKHLLEQLVHADIKVTLKPEDPNLDKKIALLRLLFSL